MPIPLSATEQEKALAAIDRHTTDEITQLKDRLKAVLPDELSILKLTNGWRAEDQNALVAALRNGDPTAIYEAWTQGNPRDTAGAEAAARQGEVKRDVARLQLNCKKPRSRFKMSPISKPRSASWRRRRPRPPRWPSRSICLRHGWRCGVIWRPR